VNEQPLLLLQGARIDRAGTPLVDGLDAVARAPRVGLVGDWSALFALLGSQARLVRGTAEIGGVPAEHAVSTGQVGLGLRDVVFPPAMRVIDYLGASARLTGLSAPVAGQQAEQVLETLGLPGLGRRKFEQLGPVERRGVLFAHALIGSPGVVALAEPLRGLDERSQEVVSSWVARTATGRRLIVSVQSADRSGPERQLLDTVDEVLVLGPGGVRAQGSPGLVLDRIGHRYSLVLAAPSPALIQQLRARGFGVGMVPTLEPSEATAMHLMIEAPTAQDLDALTELIVALRVPLLELVPVATTSVPTDAP
jgi:ABC-type multidrug transport system ATPase subunit